MTSKTVIFGFGSVAAGMATDSLMARHFRYATHIQVLRDHPDFDCIAVVDPDPVARREAQKRWGIAEVVASVEELTNPDRFHLAVVTSPASTRRAILAALPHLRAVMVEKPLGPDRGLAEHFLAEAERLGIHIQVNFWRRGDERFAQLAQGGLSEKIGPLQAIFGLYGNGLFNNGGHLIDQIRMLLGEVSWVQALGQPEPAYGPLKNDLHLPFCLGLLSGSVVMVQPLDFRHYREISLDLWGEHGRLQILHEGLTLSLHPRRANRGLVDADEITSDEADYIPITVGQALYRLYDNLAEAIAGRTTLWSGPENALRTESVLYAILTSAYQGERRITI